MDVLGRQVLCDFWDAEGLDDEELTRRTLREAVEAGGARLVEVAVHHFSPWGISGVAVMAESHLAIHTWPEHGYAAIDLFTCGTLDNDAMFNVLVDAYKPDRVVKRLAERGVQPELELQLLD
jgi:S-adenosylmethionine decarboxylase proenzyme